MHTDTNIIYADGKCKCKNSGKALADGIKGECGGGQR